jgi:hypothetical protein
MHEDFNVAEWSDALGFQEGVAGRQQVLLTGMPRSSLKRRVRSGKWQRLQRGVYATFTGPAPRQAELWAALLRAGPGATLSHHTAAELHGLTDELDDRIHVTVPAARHPARHKKIIGLVIHRSSRIDQARHPALSPPRTRVEDTVLDLVEAARDFDEASTGSLGRWAEGALPCRCLPPRLGLERNCAGARRSPKLSPTWRTEFDRCWNAGMSRALSGHTGSLRRSGRRSAVSPCMGRGRRTSIISTTNSRCAWRSTGRRLIRPTSTGTTYVAITRTRPAGLQRSGSGGRMSRSIVAVLPYWSPPPCASTAGPARRVPAPPAAR